MELIKCKNCHTEFYSEDAKRNCTNCFTCTACEKYICPQCGESVVIKDCQPIKTKNKN